MQCSTACSTWPMRDSSWYYAANQPSIQPPQQAATRILQQHQPLTKQWDEMTQRGMQIPDSQQRNPTALTSLDPRAGLKRRGLGSEPKGADNRQPHVPAHKECDRQAV